MRALLLLTATLASALVQAQVQVVEAGSGQAPSRTRSAPAANNGNELLISLYNQLEALQQEVMTLRGLVEEQGHRLEQLDEESRRRYIDLDQRLMAINIPLEPQSVGEGEGQPGTGEMRETPAGDVRTSVPFNPVVQSSVESALRNQDQPKQSVLPALDLDKLNEQELYRTALNLLLEEGNSADSVALFQNYVERFPTGRLMPNALYWQGEAYILLADYLRAREAFERVLRDYPEDPKAAGAMLKLGVVFNLMGERGMAEQTWRDLPLRYPDSTSENNLARDYLERNN